MFLQNLPEGDVGPSKTQEISGSSPKNELGRYRPSTSIFFWCMKNPLISSWTRFWIPRKKCAPQPPVEFPYFSENVYLSRDLIFTFDLNPWWTGVWIVWTSHVLDLLVCSSGQFLLVENWHVFLVFISFVLFWFVWTNEYSSRIDLNS